MTTRADKIFFEKLYNKYNLREFVHPDPLEFLYRYDDLKDREIAGLVASSLAYGRVAQILRSVSVALDAMGSSPRAFLAGSTEKGITKAFAGFRHRFTADSDIAKLMIGAKRAIEKHGSLGACFAHNIDEDSETLLPAISKFVKELGGGDGKLKGLLPAPEMGSACKRLNLFLRWMIRKDAVDPGGWKGALKVKLIIPLDTHMHRIGLELEFTRRKNADMRTALEITNAFAKISPDDPVRYDFALTRLGIRKDADKSLAKLLKIS